MKARNIQQPSASQSADSDWSKSPTANLVQYVPSGIYFARVRVKGKLFRESLKTDIYSVAQMRLKDFIRERQEDMGDDSAIRKGKMTFGQALTVFEQRLDSDARLKEGAKLYRHKTILSLKKSWPTLCETNVAKISKDDCIQWASRFAKEYSPSVYNNTLGTLRMVLDVAIELGARANNPAKAREIKKRRPTEKQLRLPEPEQFKKFVEAIDAAGAWCSHHCADLVQFLAYGGFRKTEAENVTWADCDFDKGQINVRITKNGTPRLLPMISDMVALLQRIKANRKEVEPPTAAVMRVQECQKAMDNAAKAVGMCRITHHDLRHLFATRCIESGVDIPTVSRWLGHRDGGALAMKVYGHLRDEHSAEMAAKVTFSQPKAENIIPMEQVNGTLSVAKKM